MLRILLDEHGSGSQDLFIKIDGRPTWTWVADTSWLDFFFNIADGRVWSDEELIVGKKADVALLVQLWQKMLLSDQPICYLPYNLYDQGGCVFQVIKGKKLYRIIPVWSPEIIEGVTNSYFLHIQEKVAWQQQINPLLEWELAPSSILIGLTWSLAKLEQPITPLHYN